MLEIARPEVGMLEPATVFLAIDCPYRIAQHYLAWAKST
jgi:hypothetical protein